MPLRFAAISAGAPANGIVFLYFSPFIHAGVSAMRDRYSFPIFRMDEGEDEPEDDEDFDEDWEEEDEE